jgi:STAS domain
MDLAGLEGIGYSGLSVLLRVRRWTRRSGGDLPLAAPQQPVRRILEATGLIDVFAVNPNMEEAMNRARRQAVVTGRVAAAQCRSGSLARRPVYRTVRHLLGRPLPSCGMCRPRRIARGLR